MIKMNKQQKEQFDELSQALRHSTSSGEIEYYSDSIHELLDKVEKNSLKQKRFNDEEINLYQEYKQQLLESDSIALLQR